MQLISVITIQDGVVNTVNTWQDTPENVKIAEEFFLANCTNDGESLSEEKIDDVLNAGYYEFEGSNYSVCLTHHDCMV